MNNNNTAESTNQDQNLINFSNDVKKELKLKFQDRKKESLMLAQKLQKFGFNKEKAQVSNCSKYMLFALEEHMQTKEKRKKLKAAQFCKFRFCSMCQWRRRIKYTQNILQKLDTLPKNYVYRHLILTVQNVPASDLKKAVQRMNKAFITFYRYYLKGVVGCVKALEILGKKTSSDQVHPHFHILLISKSGGQNYQSQKKLQDLWERAYKEKPAIVHIRKIRANKFFDVKAAAVLEVVKYSCKTQSLLDRSDEAFKAIINQTYRMRFIAVKGCLRGIDLSDTNLELKKENKNWREIAELIASWEKNQYNVRLKK